MKALSVFSLVLGIASSIVLGVAGLSMTVSGGWMILPGLFFMGFGLARFLAVLKDAHNAYNINKQENNKK